MDNTQLSIKSLFLIFSISFLFSDRIIAQSNGSTKGWIVKNPFDHKVFIEYKGQFTKEEEAAIGEPILYYSRKGNLNIYITKNGFIFRYDSIYKEGDDRNGKYTEGEEDGDENIRVKQEYVKVYWDGSNPNTLIEAVNETKDYFTYENPTDKTGRSGVSGNAWKKLVYHNLYEGIDVEFFYPEKGGIEYNIIARPGADISKIKMQYSGNTHLNCTDNNINIQAPFGKLIDHEPKGKDDQGNVVDLSFVLKNNSISFAAKDYDNKNTLIIDPWITFTSFDTLNHAYDLNCDKEGNTYIYGGYHPYELQKYDISGILKWTYTGIFMGYDYSIYYGSFTLDSRNGTSYIAQGITGAGFGCYLEKIDANGLLTATFTGNSQVEEIWRVGFDYCNSIIVTGNGSINPTFHQASTIDTNLTIMNPINILGTTSSFHDICLFSLDQQGHAYFATSLGLFPFDNSLIMAPLPALLPTSYMVNDGFHFMEILTQKYYPNYAHFSCSNGFNGMAANKNLLLTYDGASLKRRVNATGLLKDSVFVSDSSFQWGGIDIDCADNIYVGKQDSIIVFDTNFVRQAAIPLPDTVYDLKVGYSGQLFASGAGFVCAANYVTPYPKVNTSHTNPSSCSLSDGTATAILSCGIPPFTYLWSNGQVTQTATGLSAGTYTVKVIDANATCLPISDTGIVVIPNSSNFTLSISTDSVCSGDTIQLSASGGASYRWSNGATGSSVSITPLNTQTITVLDSNVCGDSLLSAVVYVLPKPAFSVSAIFNACIGENDTLQVMGGNSYIWSNGATNSSIIVSITKDTSFTVSVYNGKCSKDTVISIKAYPPVNFSISNPSLICAGDSITLVAGGGGTYFWSNGATTGSINVSPNSTSIYRVIVNGIM